MLNISIRNLLNISGGELLIGDIGKYGDMCITRVSYDSRDIDAGTLFVPLKGERVDSHKFISQVLSDKAFVSFSEYDDTGYQGDRIIIKVPDTVKAVKKLAVFYRSLISVPFIGVTGSVGKTTTREMISAALSSGKTVYATPGNRNSQLGTPQALFAYDDNADIAVMEMGVSMPGEMGSLADMVRPDAAVFTNIGITHIENLKTRKGILEEKIHITDHMPAGSPVFINDDNDMLHNCTLTSNLIRLTYGTDPSCDAYPEDIDETYGCPEFTAVIKGKKIPVKLGVYGRHNVYNALAALLISDYFGLDVFAAAAKLGEYKGYLHRGQILHNGGVTIIDDTYNASPDSVRAALDILSNIHTDKRRIAVLADMKELGDNTVNEHISIGKYVSDKGNIDVLFTFGELAEYMSKGAGNTECRHTGSFDELSRDVVGFLKPGDTVLFKGSNSMKLFDLVDKVMKHEYE